MCASESESGMDQKVGGSAVRSGSGCMGCEGVCEWITKQVCEYVSG